MGPGCLECYSKSQGLGGGRRQEAAQSNHRSRCSNAVGGGGGGDGVGSLSLDVLQHLQIEGWSNRPFLPSF